MTILLFVLWRISTISAKIGFPSTLIRVVELATGSATLGSLHRTLVSGQESQSLMLQIASRQV